MMAAAAAVAGDEIMSFRFRGNTFLLRTRRLVHRNILFICTYRRGYAQVRLFTRFTMCDDSHSLRILRLRKVERALIT